MPVVSFVFGSIFAYSGGAVLFRRNDIPLKTRYERIGAGLLLLLAISAGLIAAGQA